MVQSFIADITDIHRGTLSDCFQTFQNLNAICAVTVAGDDGILSCFLSHKFFS
jgi:hypothetical protein